MYTMRCARRRPYRDAWSSAKAAAYLEQRAGIEFDPALVATFMKMLREREMTVSTIGSEAA